MTSLLKILWYNQRLLVYPSGFEERPREVPTPDMLDLPFEDVELMTRDKVKLRCFLVCKEDMEKSRGTIIMFHGNAMNHGEAFFGAGNQLFSKNFNIFSLEYRGYGHSEGVPSEKGLCLDSQAAIDYVLAHPILCELPIIIYGASLGGAVAIHATSENAEKISALIIENTFTSIPDLVRGWPVIRHLWFLCTQKWYSAEKISRLPTELPILMLSGDRDEVIPRVNMERLWQVASNRGRPQKKGKGKGKGKKDELESYQPPQGDVFKSFPYGNHNNTCVQRHYWETFHEFLDNILGPS